VPESEPMLSFLSDVADGGSQGTLSYGLDQLLELDGDERSDAEALLIGLAEDGDIRAIETLGMVMCAEARPVLSTLLARGDDAGVAAARALLAISGPAEHLVKRVAAGLRTCGPLQAALAAYDLRGIQLDEARDGLLTALRREPKAARANALLGLDELLDLESLREPFQSPLQALCNRVMCETPELWQPAAAELAGKLQRLAGGATAEELGLDYCPGPHPEAIGDFLVGLDQERVDLAALEALQGDDRRWALSALVLALGLDDEDRKELAVLVLAGVNADGFLELCCVIEPEAAFLRRLERDASARVLPPRLLTQLGACLATRDTELLFDAAVALAAQPDPGRRAFLDGGRHHAVSWFEQNGEDLRLALDLV
jgi:hypothetical protein